MTRALLAIVAALAGLLLVPLALAAGTAWLVLPAHLGFSVLCCVSAVLAGLSGRPWQARVVGLAYLGLSLAMVVALSVGAQVRAGSWYWVVPWAGVLLWAWIPPPVALLAAELAKVRRAQRTRWTVGRRRAQLRRSGSGSS